MNKILNSLGIITILAFGTPADAKMTYTATAATLSNILKKVRGGDTVNLKGQFGFTQIQNHAFSSLVTFNASGAIFSDTLSLKNLTNVTLKGGTYGSATGVTTYLKAISISGGSHVVISGVKVVGNNSGAGIAFTNTITASVSDSTFSRLKAGVTMTAVTNGVIIRNKSVNSAADGFEVANSHYINISQNTCSGTSVIAGAHPDCVQLWSIKGNEPQSDIKISKNIVTGASQGFTSFDAEAGGGVRIIITENTVNTSWSQGIACYGCIDSTITGNKVSTLPGAKYRTVINVVGGRNNTVEGNDIGLYSKSKATVVETAAFRAAPDIEARSFSDYVPDQAKQTEFGRAGSFLTPIDPTAVPEPSSWMMLIVGFGLVGGRMRRRTSLTLLC